jgi:hypothetical protein
MRDDLVTGLQALWEGDVAVDAAHAGDLMAHSLGLQDVAHA